MRSEEATTGATLLGEPLPVELMNTVGVGSEGFRDALADDEGAAAWLRAVGGRIAAEAGTGPLDEDSVRQAAGSLRELRDALRLLAAEATGDPRTPVTGPNLTRPEAIAALNGLVTVRPELVWPAADHPSRVYRAHGPVGLAVALIAHQGVELLTSPRAARLRPCLAPNCLLFFVKDHARREWCSPACGNRARVARHYQRHRGTDDWEKS